MRFEAKEDRFKLVPLVVPCDCEVPTTAVNAVMPPLQKKLKPKTNFEPNFFNFFPKVA